MFYTGAAPNQQAIPAVEYLMSAEGRRRQALGAARHRLRLPAHHQQDPALLPARRRASTDEDIMEKYTPFGHSDYQTIVADIKKFAAGKRTAVVIAPSTATRTSRSTRSWATRASRPTDIPVVAFSVGEEELRGIDTKPLVGHLAAWNYFMSHGHAREQGVHRQVEGLREEEQPARRRQARHQRPDGSHLHRHPDVGPGGRAGAHHQRRRRPPGRRLPDVQGALGLRHPRWTPRTTTCTSRSFIGEVKADGQFKVVWKTEGPIRAAGLEPVHPRQRQEGRRLDLSRGSAATAPSRSSPRPPRRWRQQAK